ncbi:hypothetical protein PVAP13_5KG358914 [Panicum virgatum]|uniref:Uncharacterized protein n=1 Tax=Panicum virgatum TaxID=38727 RepID=A0A8T0SQF6_PANVG|nr:hypothetical protein PVAP13_5KG358914 [Panicum virgatum]
MFRRVLVSRTRSFWLSPVEGRGGPNFSRGPPGLVAALVVLRMTPLHCYQEPAGVLPGEVGVARNAHESRPGKAVPDVVILPARRFFSWWPPVNLTLVHAAARGSMTTVAIKIASARTHA